LAMYLNWQLCTLIGVLFGQSVPNLAAWGLDFAMLATFIGVVVPVLRNRPQVAAALVAGGVALACHGWPYKLGLLAAAASGIVVGLLLERHAARAGEFV
jgi:predicted branched-subunit amino acid permease